MTTVAAVVVTWNRRQLLLESLAAVAAQTRPPELTVVVDNASTDGSVDAVRASFPGADLVTMSRNTGGAGGFAVGLERAVAAGADLVWLMDDDTVPEPGALAALLRARDGYPHGRPALLASRVVWTDLRDHPMNTPRPKPMSGRRERAAAQLVGCVPIRSASFVSVLVDAEVYRRRGGGPVADYFLWNDDFEFTTRMLRGNVGLLCPDSVVVHKTRTFGSTDADPGDRFFYEVRNKAWLLSRSRSLAPLEKLVYGGSTLRRWGRTLARSKQRGVLWRAMVRGLRDGVRTAPRSNAEVLAGALPHAPAPRLHIPPAP